MENQIDLLEQEAFKIVDNFLSKLSRKEECSYHSLAEINNKTEGQIAWNILCEHGLILFRNGKINSRDSYLDISQPGIHVLKNGGYAAFHIKRKKELEEERLRISTEAEKNEIDLKLAKLTLSDYSTTKRKANIAIIVSLILVAIEIIKWFKK